MEVVRGWRVAEHWFHGLAAIHAEPVGAAEAIRPKSCAIDVYGTLQRGSCNCGALALAPLHCSARALLHRAQSPDGSQRSKQVPSSLLQETNHCSIAGTDAECRKSSTLCACCDAVGSSELQAPRHVPDHLSIKVEWAGGGPLDRSSRPADLAHLGAAHRTVRVPGRAGDPCEEGAL